MDNSGRRDFLNPLKAIKAFRDESREPTVEVPASQITNTQELDEDSLLYVAKPAMACTFQIYFSPHQGDETMEAAIDALELVEQLENQMTVYRDSPMTYINETAPEEPIRVENRLFQLLQKGIELYEITHGAFDMTAGLLTKAWGFYRKQGRVPDATEIEQVLQDVGSDKIKVHPDNESIQYLAANLEINLGAIGKGHALDRVAEFMTQFGLENFLIHGGQSSVLAHGMRWKSTDPKSSQADPWKVGLIHPLHPDKRIAEIKLNNKALGTSGTARQSFYHKGKRYGHIIDPRTGQPSEGVYSATAIAPTAAEADALATAFYVMGGDASVAFCQKYPQYACIVLSPEKSGQVQIQQQGLAEGEIQFL